MSKLIVDDELWEVIRPLLPRRKRRFRFPGRKPFDDRRCLNGILFVLRTGIPWEHLPQEAGWGSGMTCWRRLRDWQEAGVWERLHELVLARLQAADKIDWSRAAVDSSSIRAVGAGEKNRPQLHGSQPSGQQASRARRRRRNPFGHLLDRRQSPRRHAAGAAR